MASPIANLISGSPLLAIFEVCLRCNSACGYCDLPLNQGRYELSRAEIRRIFADLYRDGVRYVFVQGGEPLVRKDLLGVLEDLVGIGLGVTLITNGTRFNPHLVQQLSRLAVNVSVSLDTLDRARYGQIRGADQLPMVLRGIELLQQLTQPKFITCIVSESNREDVLDVVRFARGKGFIPIVGAYHWDIERYGKVDRELQYERESARAVFETVLQSGLVPRGYYRQYVRDTITWLKGGRLGGCDAGRYSVAIDASGNVAPCLALKAAGNLRQQSLGQILQQMDHKAVRSCSDQSTCNLLCSRVVGTALRRPLTTLLTPKRVAPCDA